MLIKKRKLEGLRSTGILNLVDVSESTKLAQLEIQKARQEAKTIKQEAEIILQESQKKLKEAEEKAKEIIKNTNLEAKKIKEDVYKETLQLAKAEAEKLKIESRELLKELFEVKRAALIQAHNEIINVALALAEKIIRYQATTDSNLLKTQVIEAIKKATSEADRVQVFVNPSDLKNLEENIVEIEKLFPHGVEVVALANESVDPGSCIVETKSGQLDASFSAQLKTLTELVLHLEVQEPSISFAESTKVIEQEEKEILETPIELEEKQEELLTREEEEILKDESLGNELLIEVSEEESFPFATSRLQEEIPIIQQEVQGEIPQVVDKQIQEEITAEDITAADLEEKVIAVKEGKDTIKKSLDLDDLTSRTEEEQRELDEGLEFEVEEEEEEEEEEEAKEEKEVVDLSNILRPKKKPSSSVSDVVNEVEQSPEWKNLIEDEE